MAREVTGTPDRRAAPQGHETGGAVYNRRVRIVVGADHRGVALKRRVLSAMAGAGHDCTDLGVHSEDPADYPDVARQAAEGVAAGRFDRGVLICGSGVGMSIAANKVPGARAALVHTVEGARLCREHNDANVLALAGGTLAPHDAGAVVAAFLDTPFAGGRHRRRVDKIIAMERQAERRAPAATPTPA